MRRGRQLVDAGQTMTRRRAVAGLLAAGAALRGARPGVARQEANQGGPVASPAATPGVVPPDSPIGRQVAWLLDQLNTPSPPEGATLGERFAPDFLRAIPPERVAAVLGQVAAAGPVALERYEEGSGGTEARAILVLAAGDRLQASIAVEPVAPFRIAGLLIEPAAPAATPAPLASWAEFDRRWAGLAPRVAFLAAEIGDGGLRPIHALNGTERLAIGSAFKLYLLGELARQVAAGARDWDEPLAIRDEWKSLPPGEFRRLPAGTERPLRAFAAQAISASDNTAADHLLFALGRERVEAAQREMGHGDPAVNVPFLSTREAFVLKLVAPAPEVAAYLAAPVAAKRRLLATEIGPRPLSLDDAAGWTAPRRIETIEWFASAEELCQAMAHLATWGDEPKLAPVGEILAINPGLPLDRTTWPAVGFKGGAEVGVLNLTWLLQRRDGRRFALSAGLNDASAPLDEAAALDLLRAALDLLATVA